MLIEKRKMYNVNVYDTQAHCTYTRKRNYRWFWYSKVDLLLGSCNGLQQKKSGKISRFITELKYTVKENEADTTERMWNNHKLLLYNYHRNTT